MYQCSKKLIRYKEYSCFDRSDFAVCSMFTFDVCWHIGNSSSAANNTWSRLPSRLSFRFLWLWPNGVVSNLQVSNLSVFSFKLGKSDLLEKLDVSTSVAFFKSAYVA